MKGQKKMKHRKLFYWESGQTLAHIAQRCYVASILSHIQKQTGAGLEQPALVDCFKQGSWITRCSKVLSNFSHSVILSILLA